MKEEIILFESAVDLESAFEQRHMVKICIAQNTFLLVTFKQKFYLIESQCPHFDYSLEDAAISPYGEIVCPWHGYRFKLAQGGAESAERCRSLKVYETYADQESGQIMVRID